MRVPTGALCPQGNHGVYACVCTHIADTVRVYVCRAAANTVYVAHHECPQVFIACAHICTLCGVHDYTTRVCTRTRCARAWTHVCISVCMCVCCVRDSSSQPCPPPAVTCAPDPRPPWVGKCGGLFSLARKAGGADPTGRDTQPPLLDRVSPPAAATTASLLHAAIL